MPSNPLLLHVAMALLSNFVTYLLTCGIIDFMGVAKEKYFKPDFEEIDAARLSIARSNL